ncbi:uncharacterized protein LOC135368598 [Ornithodoros turicata]|uniref:uncharacterized protein LOC135368598 n=1 Tax=Ornithodoros turicata TaxID=34597 RepID=UPI00313966BB
MPGRISKIAGHPSPGRRFHLVGATMHKFSVPCLLLLLVYVCTTSGNPDKDDASEVHEIASSDQLKSGPQDVIGRIVGGRTATLLTARGKRIPAFASPKSGQSGPEGNNVSAGTSTKRPSSGFKKPTAAPSDRTDPFRNKTTGHSGPPNRQTPSSGTTPGLRPLSKDRDGVYRIPSSSNSASGASSGNRGHSHNGHDSRHNNDTPRRQTGHNGDRDFVAEEPRAHVQPYGSPSAHNPAQPTSFGFSGLHPGLDGIQTEVAKNVDAIRKSVQASNGGFMGFDLDVGESNVQPFIYGKPSSFGYNGARSVQQVHDTGLSGPRYGYSGNRAYGK